MNLYDRIKEPWSFDDVEGLKSYLNNVWQSRPLFLSDDDDEEERRGTDQRFFTLTENHIRPKNYVGFVQYGDLRINIYPRVFKDHPFINCSHDPLVAINHVLKWLSYGTRIHFPFNEVPLQIESQDDWLEALIFLFANYTLDALSTSPHFAYQEVTEEMTFVRGRIAMQPYLNNNLAKGRHHLLHCTYEPFLYDNQFNRIVKHTCKILQSVTVNNANSFLLNDILFLLDEVTDIYSTSEDCAKVPVNRLNPEVGTITNMCSAFLSNQAYTGGLANNQNLCILLPMEVIYEQYIAGFIQEHFSQLKAVPQASGEYVAQTGNGFTKNVFQMRHDIFIPKVMIIDTKYKFRYASDDCKGGVNQNDIYQMVTYCYKRRMKQGLLLYPKHFHADANNETHQFKVQAEEGDMMIHASSIDLIENDFSLFEEEQKAKFLEFLF